MQDDPVLSSSKKNAMQNAKKNAMKSTKSDDSVASCFDRLSHSWWDRRGAFSMLHKLQPARMRYLRQALSAHFASSADSSADVAGGSTSASGFSTPVPRLRVLDIGCGGGLLSESLARLGFEVVGIDKSLPSIEVARAHAREYMPEHAGAASGQGAERASPLPISYHHADLSDFAKNEPSRRRFDLICAMEIIEHTQDPQEFLDLASQLLRPNGLFLVSTLNRTFESWLKGIIVAEHLLGLLPRSTHDWQRFITPLELESLATGSGLRVIDFCGMRYRPLRDDFVLDPSSLSFNYIASASKDV